MWGLVSLQEGGVADNVTWQDPPPQKKKSSPHPFWTQINCFPCVHTEDTTSPRVTVELVSRPAV